jgi:hypothetical protein
VARRARRQAALGDGRSSGRAGGAWQRAALAAWRRPKTIWGGWMASSATSSTWRWLEAIWGGWTARPATSSARRLMTVGNQDRATARKAPSPSSPGTRKMGIRDGVLPGQSYWPMYKQTDSFKHSMNIRSCQMFQTILIAYELQQQLSN